MTTNYNTPTYYGLPNDILISTGGSNITAVNKFGFSGAIIDTERSVWDGAVSTNCNYLASPSKVNVVSDDANDAAAGTGARTVEIFGLDVDNKEISEVIVLDGTTLVESVNVYNGAPNRQLVLTVGSGGVNAGKLYVFTGTATGGTPDDLNLVYSRVTEGMSQTLQANYTVPANKVALMDFLEVINLGGNNAEATVRLIAKPPGGAWNTKRKFVFENGVVTRKWDKAPPTFSAGTNIEVRAERTSGSGSLNVSAEFDLRLVPQG